MLKNTSLGEVITIGAIVLVIVLVFRLGADNKKLSEENGRLSAQYEEQNQKNQAMFDLMTSQQEQILQINRIVATESRRRAAAEMKSQRLNEEVKDALKGNVCAIEPLPASVINGLRKAADSARGSKSKKPTDTGKSTD